MRLYSWLQYLNRNQKVKIALYCQNVLGIGHLSRSLNLARELVSDHQVHFIQGGPKVDLALNHPHFHHHRLEPVLMNLEGQLYSPNQITMERVWQRRMEELEIIGASAFDALIIEFFPFGRYQFRVEILDFIKRQKALNPKCKIICSMRDIYTIKNNPEKVIKRAKYSAEILNRYFDHLLIHSDPSFIKLSDSYMFASEIKIEQSYTGYIAPLKLFSGGRSQDEIVVSTGGGSFGLDLLKGVLAVTNEFKSLQFHIFKSALDPEELSSNRDNVHFHSFNENEFKRHLAKAKLSISLAGYNTVAEALLYQTPMLLYPFTHNNEQPLRARALEQSALASVLSPSADLATQLREHLKKITPLSPASSLIKLDGASQSLNIINMLLAL